MPYASNALDGSRVYFEEDNGGDEAAVVLHGGLLDSVDLVRGSHIVQALQRPPEEFRLIYVDHRGLGWSDKPHDADAYAMPLRVGDAVAVLDELGIERAHFIGNSWGHSHKSSNCNASLSFSATVGEEPEVEVALVYRLRARALFMGLRAKSVLRSSSWQGTALQVVSSFGYPICSPSSGYPALSHSSRPEA